MATTRARARATVPLLLFLLGTGLLCAAAYSREEEEGRGETLLRQCVRRCEKDRPRYQQAQCVQECRERQQEREREGRREEGRGRRGEGEGSWDRERERESRREEQEEGRERESRREEQEERQRQRQREGEESQSQSGHPYVFGPRSFRCLVGSSEQGCIKALPPFHEASKLLRSIRGYRVAVLEANPRYFVSPGYTDSHGIAYVVQGEGAVTLYQKDEKRSFRVREGDIFVAPAGSFMHAANTDGRRKLVVVKILHTISVPGELQFFSGTSVVSGLSKRIQRAAFKTSEDHLERLFGRQGKKGFIVRASEEQIGELRRRATEGGQGPHWPLPPFGESHGPYNLLEQRPRIANRHGRLYEVDASSYGDLAEHDLRVTLVNITAGSMSAPFYNTRSVKVAVVLDGEGEVEIVCPHLSRRGDRERRGRSEEGRSEHGKGSRRREEREEEEEEEQGGECQGDEHKQQGRYETVHARLSRGAAFVVPVGHPVVAVASRSSNLQIVCFEVHADKNERVYLAGANSVLRKLDRPAKELAFSQSEREVDEVLNAQQDVGFLQGPEESGGRREEEEERGRGRGEVAVEALLRMAAGGL